MVCPITSGDHNKITDTSAVVMIISDDLEHK